MAYADQDEGISTNRVIAIGIVALLHAGLGYGIVTGLAYDAAKQVFEDLKTFDVEEEVPEEPEEPPPPPEKLDIPPPPKVTWRFGERPMSKRCGSGNASGSKFAAMYQVTTLSPVATC